MGEFQSRAILGRRVVTIGDLRTALDRARRDVPGTSWNSLGHVLRRIRDRIIRIRGCLHVRVRALLGTSPRSPSDWYFLCIYKIELGEMNYLFSFGRLDKRNWLLKLDGWVWWNLCISSHQFRSSSLDDSSRKMNSFRICIYVLRFSSCWDFGRKLRSTSVEGEKSRSDIWEGLVTIEPSIANGADGIGSNWESFSSPSKVKMTSRADKVDRFPNKININVTKIQQLVRNRGIVRRKDSFHCFVE